MPNWFFVRLVLSTQKKKKTTHTHTTIDLRSRQFKGGKQIKTISHHFYSQLISAKMLKSKHTLSIQIVNVFDFIYFFQWFVLFFLISISVHSLCYTSPSKGGLFFCCCCFALFFLFAIRHPTIYRHKKYI